MQKSSKRVVAVTGGASGIGEACVRVFAAAGDFVVVLDRNHDRAVEVAREVGGQAVFLDVSSEESVVAACQEVETDIGPVFGLVNSAGIIQYPTPLHDFDIATFDQVQNIDMRGTFLACKEFSRAMRARSGGVIVNIASVTAYRSTPLHSYGPAKAAILNMSQCLAAELGAFGIRVNSVSPGYTLTPAMQTAIDKKERDVRSLESNAALRRLVLPEEVASAVAFLVSDGASAITGIDLPVDAGILAGTPWQIYGGLRE